MPYQDRKDLIEQIQERNESKVIAYVLSDREVLPRNAPLPLRANIAQNAKEIIYKALREIGEQQNLDLFIYSRGGDTNAVWPIVSVLREFSNHLRVLVPFRNHSAGTMIALGANEIVMSKMGELSPIDPTTGNQFNPIDETNRATRRGISVEDLNAYFELAKVKFGLGGDQILDVFKELTREVHPLALGNVNRVLSQSKLLARKLLGLHLAEDEHEAKLESITDALTVEFFSHLHFINRKEAVEILGDEIVKEPDTELEGLMMDLLDSYYNALGMNNIYSLFAEMGNQQQRNIELRSGLIETDTTSFLFKTDLTIYQGSEIPSNINVTLQPGQVVLPIIQGLPKTFRWEATSQTWEPNTQGV